MDILHRLKGHRASAYMDGTKHISEADWADAIQEIERLRAALQHFESYGCPACGGDCSAANPPMICCPMSELRAALSTAPHRVEINNRNPA